jgi:hypothetical protein
VVPDDVCYMSAVAKTFTNGIALGVQLPFTHTKGAGIDLWEETATMPPLFRSITRLLGVMGEWRSSDCEMRQRVEISHAALASG